MRRDVVEWVGLAVFVCAAVAFVVTDGTAFWLVCCLGLVVAALGMFRGRVRRVR